MFKHFGLSNAFTKRFPEMAMPMLQRYHPEAMKKIYSLSGFRDMSGSHIVMQAALKILQQPRHLGIGLCFEEAEVIPDIAHRRFGCANALDITERSSWSSSSRKDGCC